MGLCTEQSDSADATVAGSQRSKSLLTRLECIPFCQWHVKLRMIVGIATFFDAFDAIAIAYIMPVLIPLWHISVAQVGLLLSISYVGQIIGAFLAGWAAERFGRKKSLIVSILLMAAMSIGCVCARSYMVLLVCRVIQGIGLGGEVPVAATYINEWSKAKGRGRFFVLYEAIFFVGLVVCALLGTILIPVCGWEIMFVIGALPALIIPAMVKLCPESPRWLINHGYLDRADKAISSVEKAVITYGYDLLSAEEIKVGDPSEKCTRLGELFGNAYRVRTLTIWVLWFSTYFVYYGIATWLPTLYRTMFKLPLQKSLIFSLVFSACGLIGVLISAFCVDKFGRKPVLVVGFLATIIVCAALAFDGITSAYHLLFTVSTGGVFLSASTVVLYLYTPELYPTRMRALGCSVSTVWMRIASALGPNAVAVVVAKYSLSAMFVIFGAIAAVGLIVIVLFGIETKSRVLEEVSP